MRSCIYCGKTLEKTEKCTCSQSIRAREAKKKVNFDSSGSENSWHSADNVYTTGYTRREKKKKKIVFGGVSLSEYLKDPIKGISALKACKLWQLLIMLFFECMVFAVANFLIFKSISITAFATLGLLVMLFMFLGINRFVLKRREFALFATRLIYALLLPSIVMLAGGRLGVFSAVIPAVCVMAGLLAAAVLIYEALRSEWNFLKTGMVFYIVMAGFLFGLTAFFTLCAI